MTALPASSAAARRAASSELLCPNCFVLPHLHPPLINTSCFFTFSLYLFKLSIIFQNIILLYFQYNKIAIRHFIFYK